MRASVVFMFIFVIFAAAFGDDFSCPLNWKFSKWENECTAICLKSVEVGVEIKQVPVRIVPLDRKCGPSKKCQYAKDKVPVTGVCI